MRLSTLGGPCQGVLCEERVLPSTASCPSRARCQSEHVACLPVAGPAAWPCLTLEATLSDLYTGRLGRDGWRQHAGTLRSPRRSAPEVAVTSSSEDKLGKVRTLGADFTANYRRPGWGELVRRWSGGGVETVLEIGGNETFEQSVRRNPR